MPDAKNKKRTRDDEELRASIWKDPIADGPRVVYCDWLLEQNDPRGELMALQLAKKTRKLKKDESAREKALIAEHGTTWLGPLANVLMKTGLTFDRGFVSSAHVIKGVDVDMPEHAHHPAWSTLATLHGAAPPSSIEMPLLRKLTHLQNADIHRLAARCSSSTNNNPLTALESLSWDGPTGLAYTAREFDKSGRQAIAAFRALTCLPSLKRLELIGEHSWPADAWKLDSTNGITPDLLSFAWESPTCSNLEELRFSSALRYLPDLIARIAIGGINKVIINDAAETSAQYGTLSTLTRPKKRSAFSQLQIRHRTDRHNLSHYIAQFERLPRDLFTKIELIIDEHTWKTFTEKRRLNSAFANQTNLQSKATITFA